MPIPARADQTTPVRRTARETPSRTRQRERTLTEAAANIIAADYAEEFVKGKNPRLIRGTRIDSAKKPRLQSDIGKFYCT